MATKKRATTKKTAKKKAAKKKAAKKKTATKKTAKKKTATKKTATKKTAKKKTAKKKTATKKTAKKKTAKKKAAKKKTAKKRAGRSAPPAAGAAFAMPLDDGRYGVCRVLRGTESEEERAVVGKGWVLVALSPWTGSSLPTGRERKLRSVLKRLVSWPGMRPKKVSHKVWVKGPAPKDFVKISDLPPTPAELELQDYYPGITWAKVPEWESVRATLQRLC